MMTRIFGWNFIHVCRRISVPFARFGIFLVYGWFGALKVIGQSPASPLVQALFERTMGGMMSFDVFMVAFGLFECLIGILFLIRGTERVVIPLLAIHLVTTVMPLFVVTQATWSGFMVPTMEGQYIIKNVLIVAAAILVAAHMHPASRTAHR